MIGYVRRLYADENEFIKELDATVYALDSTTIDLCLNLFPWAKFKKAKGAIKAHTLIDIQGSIPTWIFITEGTVHDVNVLDYLPIEAGAFYVMDRGYVDFERLFKIHEQSATWITMGKDNMKFKRQYSLKTDRAKGLIYDQTIILNGFYSTKKYTDKIHRIKFKDSQTGKTYEFITNNFKIEALTICHLY